MYISNLTNSPNITVESKFVINRQTINNDAILKGFTKNDLLFVKLTFNGIDSKEKISKVLLNMYFQKLFATTGAKIIQCESTNFSDSNLIRITQSMTNNETVIDKIIIDGTEKSIISNPSARSFSFDITKIARGKSNLFSVMLAISFPNNPNNYLEIYSPQLYSNSLKVCEVITTEVCGLNSMYKYDEHDLGQAGKVFINLFTGKPIYSCSLVSTPSKKMPISFSLFQNLDNTDEIVHFKNKITPSFHYRIYTIDNFYVIEDPTGFKKNYQRVDDSIALEKLKEIYGIKERKNGYELYFCSFDFTYFYIKNLNGNKNIELNDKSGTITTFEVNSSCAKIKEIKNSLGYKLTYTWNGNRLISVANDDGDSMVLEYVEPGYISKVSFPNMHRYIKINQIDDITNIKVYYEKVENGVTSTDILCDLTIDFYINQLTYIYNNISRDFLKIESDSNGKVRSAGVFCQNGEKKIYLNRYLFWQNYSSVSDLEGNSLYYYFDMYGRLKTVMDDNARTITYNYAEVEDGVSKNKIAESKVQTNSRNFLDNSSFENEDLTANGSPVWYENSSSAGEMKVVNGGVFGDKCLEIKSFNTNSFIVSQDVINPSSGSFSLSGFIKHPLTTNLNNNNVLVKLAGTYQVDEIVTTKVDSATTTTTIVPVTKTFETQAVLDFTKTDWYHFKTSKVTIPSDAYDIQMSVKFILANYTTSIYIDGLQLTNAKFNTRHNLIENGYMEYFDNDGRPRGWDFENVDTLDRVMKISNSIHSSIIGNSVMKIASGNCDFDIITNTYKLKRMSKKINITGLAGEQFVYSVLGKADVTNNVIFRTFITFTYENKGEKTYYFDFDKNFDNWQMLTRDIVTEDNFTKVVVGVEYDGGVEASFDCFQLYKDSYGKYYNYDNYGNLIETVNADGNSTKMIYNSDNKVEEIYSSDGSHFKYKYNNGLLVSAQDLHGNFIEFEYDENDRVKKQTITSGDETIVTTKQYDDINNTETTIDAFGKSSTVALDYLKRVSSYTNQLSQQMNYIYNNKMQLTNIKTKLDSLVHKNNFVYDDTGKQTVFESYNGNHYSLTYDCFNRVMAVKCNGLSYESYEYDPLIDGYSKGNLIKKTIGENQHYYEFGYNDDGELIEYKLNGDIVATYSYDDAGNLYELCDVVNDVNYHFEYDLKGNLVKEVSSNGNRLSYIYDNLGNVQKVSYNINNMLRSIDYEYEYEANEYSKEGYFNRLATIFNDELIISDSSQYGTQMLSSEYHKILDEELNMEVVSFPYCRSQILYDLNCVNKNNKNHEMWKRNFYYNKTFYAWIKPKKFISNHLTLKTNVFSFKKKIKTTEDEVEEVLSYLSIDENGRLIYHSNGSSPILLSENTLLYDKWNLVGIQFTKPIDQTSSQARIILNNMITENLNINENVFDLKYLSLSDNSSIAHPDSCPQITLHFAMTSIGAYSYNESDFKSIYAEGMKYLVKNNVERINGIHYYNEYVYDGFDVITLNGSLESTKGLKPYKIVEVDKSYRFDKNKIFKYDEESKRLVYASLIDAPVLKKGNSSSLAYKLPLKTQWTLSLRFKYISSNTEKCIFSFTNDSEEKLGIYITETDSFKFIINGAIVSSQVNSTVLAEPNVLSNLVLRYNGNNLLVCYNNKTIYNFNNIIDLTDSIVYFGNHITTNKPLNGYLEMIAFAETAVSYIVLEKIIGNGNSISARNKIDKLGRLINNTISINNKKHVTSYLYDKTRVISQTLPNNDSISYLYNDVGQVVSKTYNSPNKSVTERYKYDNLGRLIEEVYQDGTVHKYSYDRGGNFTYDKTYVDQSLISNLKYEYNIGRLMNIVDETTSETVQQITYENSNNDFYPLLFSGNNISKVCVWDGKRLMRFGDNYYTYNAEGIRTKKQTPNELTTYCLEGNNIISMNKTVDNTIYRLDFIYDSNNQIIGLNTSEGNYFYIKDITGNILGLIDSNGDFVVKYKYNAWGELLEKDIVTTCIASEHNPFIYKGYYFDDETNFYYLNTRYYAPELHRFISPDNYEYLETGSVNGLNLYVYCNNEPIMYKDSTGKYPEIIGIVVDALSDFLNSLGKMIFKQAGNYLDNPLTLKQAQKIIRKRGLKQSARSLLTEYSDDALKSLKLGYDLKKIGKYLQRGMLAVDLIFSFSENLLNGEESWFTDFLVDGAISLVIYLLPGGFWVSLGATILTICFEDEIEEFKDTFYNGWKDFWNFSWV